MVISKRANRVGLPQINDNDSCLSEPICAPANLEAQQLVHFRSRLVFHAGQQQNKKGHTILFAFLAVEVCRVELMQEV